MGKVGMRKEQTRNPEKFSSFFLELTAMSESIEQNPTVFMVVEGYGFAEAS